MIDKKEYLALKREIRCLCRANVIKLCDDMQLNTEERDLLISFYEGKLRTRVCYDMAISRTYYADHMKLLFSKIKDYKSTFK